MSNLYRALVDLLPSRPLEVGTVTGVGDGVVTVELPGGGLRIVRGEAAVGNRVFIRDGAIEGPAPSLAFVTLEV